MPSLNMRLLSLIIGTALALAAQVNHNDDQQLKVETAESAGLAFRAGEEALSNQQYDLAKLYFDRAYALISPLVPEGITSGILLFDMALVYEKGNADHEHAKEAAEHAIRILDVKAPENGYTASCWELLGQLYAAQGKDAEAIDDFNKAIAIGRKLKSPAIAETLRDLADALVRQKNLDLALSSLRESIEIHAQKNSSRPFLIRALLRFTVVEQLAGRSGEADRLWVQVFPSNRGVADELVRYALLAREQGKPVYTELLFARRLAIFHELDPEGRDEAEALIDMGAILDDEGRVDDARPALLHAVAILDRIEPDGLELANALHNLGNAWRAAGNLKEAERVHSHAMSIRERLVPNSLVLVKSQIALANVLASRGEVGGAKDLYRKAVERLRKEQDPGIELANIRTTLASIEGNTGEIETGIAELRRLIVEQERPGGNMALLGLQYQQLGWLLEKTDDLTGAAHALRRSLEIDEKEKPESLDLADTLGDLANVLVLLNLPVEAEPLFTRALAIQQKLAPDSASAAESLLVQALFLKARSKQEDAIPVLKQALNALDAQMENIGGDPNVAAHFRSRYDLVADEYIDTLIAVRDQEAAFNVLERSRARSFLSMMAERGPVNTSELPSEFLTEKQAIDSETRRLELNLLRADIASRTSERKTIQADLEKLAVQRQILTGKVRLQLPRLLAVRYPAPIDLPAARRSLDVGTVLVSYFVGRKNTTVFVVKPEGAAAPWLITLVIDIGEAEFRQRVMDLRKRIEGREGGIGKRAPRQGAGVPSQDFFSLSHDLYRVLLEPAEKYLGDAKRLLIIPDGPLNLLPFGALVRNDGEHMSFLAEWKSLHIAPSFSAYQELRSLPHSTARTTAVAFGNPNFTGQNTSQANLQRSFIRPGNLTFDSLPGTQEELNAIADLFPNSSRVFAGSEARKGNVLQFGPTARYLHLATHAVVDEDISSNSSILLSGAGNPTADPDQSILQTWEVLESLRLDSELVVLSACRTGLGEEISGEGIVNFTRAFHYAGARSVLSSLWSVQDAATARLMRSFYTNLRDKLSKDEALKKAEIEVMRDPATSAPYFWAAFTLSGDWQ